MDGTDITFCCFGTSIGLPIYTEYFARDRPPCDATYEAAASMRWQKYHTDKFTDLVETSEFAHTGLV